MRLPVAVHFPVLGSYTSAEPPAASQQPPNTSTLPSPSLTANCCVRAVIMLPVAVHFPVRGS